MMNSKKIVAIAFGLTMDMALKPAMGAEDKSNSVYVYKTPNQSWCAVRSSSDFKNRSTSIAADQYSLDQGTVRFKNGNVLEIEEYNTTEDNEVSTLADYWVTPSGVIDRATLQIRGEGSRLVVSYRVIGGRYVYDGPGNSPEGIMFRRARTAFDFPFADLIMKFKSTNLPREICQ